MKRLMHDADAETRSVLPVGIVPWMKLQKVGNCVRFRYWAEASSFTRSLDTAYSNLCFGQCCGLLLSSIERMCPQEKTDLVPDLELFEVLGLTGCREVSVVGV